MQIETYNTLLAVISSWSITLNAIFMARRTDRISNIGVITIKIYGTFFKTFGFLKKVIIAANSTFVARWTPTFRTFFVTGGTYWI